MAYDITQTDKTILRSETGRWFGRVALHERPDGVWVLTYREAAGHSTNEEGRLHIRFSDDRGQSWTAENTRLNGTTLGKWPAYPPGAEPDGTAHGPGEPWLLECPNGDLLLHCWHADYGALGGTNPNGTYQLRSTDGGETWGDWVQVGFAGMVDDQRVFTTGDDFLLDGVMYTTARKYDSTADNIRNHLIKSTDNGGTWEEVGQMTTFTDNTAEAGIEYVGGDHIVAVTNTKDRSATYWTESIDMGQTWQTPTDITSSVDIWDRPRIWTMAHLRDRDIRQSFPQWWEDDFLIGIGDYEQDTTDSGPDRVNSVWYSEDAGQSWTGPITIDSTAAGQDAGYGDVLIGPDGEPTVVSYQGPGFDEASIRQYRLDVSPSNPAAYSPPVLPTS